MKIMIWKCPEPPRFMTAWNYEFDLEKPMWLDKNKQEFIRHARTRFYQDNFIEQIDFDYLDFQVIEEDY